MYYLLALAFCAFSLSASTVVQTDFQHLEKSEVATIRNAAFDLVDVLNLTQDQQNVLMNYFQAAGKMAEAECIFMTLYAQVLRSLAYVKEAQSLSDEERTAFAHQLAGLNRSVSIKSDCSISLAEIEDYLDDRDEYACLIHMLRISFASAHGILWE